MVEPEEPSAEMSSRWTRVCALARLTHLRARVTGGARDLIPRGNPRGRARVGLHATAGRCVRGAALLGAVGEFDYHVGFYLGGGLSLIADYEADALWLRTVPEAPKVRSLER